MTIKKSAFSILLALSCGFTSAGEREDLLQLKSTTEKLIRLLVEQGVLTQEKADALIREAQSTAPADAGEPAAEDTVRVPYVPETVKDEMREEIKKEVLAQAKQERWGMPGTLPEWIERIKWEGDMRLRGQADRFADDNARNTYIDFANVNGRGGIGNVSDPFLNTTEERERLRVRLRLGLQAQLSEQWKGAARITTGNTADPVSTNQTLGNTARPYNLVLDRLYLNYVPHKNVSLWGGRIPNPWFGTDLVWDNDLNFEGLAAQFKTALPRAAAIKPFATAGVFPLQEFERTSKDKWLFGGQAGIVWELRQNSEFKLGVGYYDYENIEGVRNALDSNLEDTRAPQSLQKGNTLFDIRNDDDLDSNLFALASDYDEVNVTTSVDLGYFDPTRVVLSADYVKNVGYDRQEILARTGADIEERNEGYQLKLLVGKPETKKRGDWHVVGGYKHLERDAVLDAFTDSDFHLGGTDAEGWLLGGSYGLAENTWLSLLWLSADEIDGPPLAIDVLQLDLNARF